MYHGVINVYKESGFTSFDVVAKLRGILRQKKIGHTGTLDPEAEGVLVVCLGKATRLCEVLTDKDKSYEATLLLGKRTDTEDSTGTVLSQQEVSVSEQEVREAILSFVGGYDQIPPMYSAIKVHGKKLYELARAGIEVERAPRHVMIHAIEIESMELPYVRFRISCGKGTYIRSLCRDIGDRLGCGGIMDKLVRDSVNATETGRIFTKEDALTLQQIEELERAGSLEKYILPIDSLFPKLERRYVTTAGHKKLYNGNLLKAGDFAGDRSRQGEDDSMICADGTECLVYDEKGTFTAIYRYHASIRAWKAAKMFL
ncbi:MAG: tRNA pseudouridine(55) synthase TruB [Lachnospiraceae bacterium]|nr:tRNA pseudouridine(55) synthase TruB [Lachnospiraceae bacterium]